MPAKIHLIFLVSLCMMLLVSSACAADGIGRVCITRIPMGERWDANDTGAKQSNTFTVQLDKLAPVLVTTNVSGVFTNLSLAGEHSVSIRLAGKPLTSFRFSFNGRGDHLRLWYNPFYGSWSLSDVRLGEKCACTKAKASNQAALGNGAMTILSHAERSAGAVPGKRCWLKGARRCKR